MPIRFTDSRRFKETSLYASLAQRPFGFVDVGAAGGIHPVVAPLADLTSCVCFEPDPVAFAALTADASGGPFRNFQAFQVAIGGKAAQHALYLTRSNVCISLLEPGSELPSRYGLRSLELVGTTTVQTETLDQLFADKPQIWAEFIKLDCQGAELDILQGAENVLKSQCVALQVEAEFFTFYKGQKLFHELDAYLRDLGFQLYGLSPHYLSAKKLDRTNFDTQERLAWADTVYLKDPLAYGSKTTLSRRNLQALLVSAIALKFYDFAIELAEHYFAENLSEKASIVEFVHDLASADRLALEADLHELIRQVGTAPEKAFVLARKFIDRNKSNCDFDNIKI